MPWLVLAEVLQHGPRRVKWGFHDQVWLDRLDHLNRSFAVARQTEVLVHAIDPLARQV